MSNEKVGTLLNGNTVAGYSQYRVSLFLPFDLAADEVVKSAVLTTGKIRGRGMRGATRRSGVANK